MTEANVTVTIDTREVLDLSVLLVELAGNSANRLAASLDSLPSDVISSKGNKSSVFAAGILVAEYELSQVADKIQQARRIMEGLEQHNRSPVASATSLEGFASFLGRLEKENDNTEEVSDESTEES